MSHEFDEDKRTRLQSEMAALTHGNRLLMGEKLAELLSLVTTYSDGEAQRDLEDLRDWFWGEALPAAAMPKRKKKGATP